MATRHAQLKWGILFRDRIYIEVYGKKKAYELLYHLSSCVNGLTVRPLNDTKKAKKPGGLAAGDYYKNWRAKNRDKIRAYQREYRSRKRSK